MDKNYEIGDVIKFDSHGTIREGLFLQYVENKIKIVLRGDVKTQGVKVLIDKNQILQ